MKALKRNPEGRLRQKHEWTDKQGNDLYFSHSGNTAKWHVSAVGYNSDGKRFVAHHGNGAETLFVTIPKFVANLEEVKAYAEKKHRDFETGNKKEHEEKLQEVSKAVSVNVER